MSIMRILVKIYSNIMKLYCGSKPSMSCGLYLNGLPVNVAWADMVIWTIMTSVITSYETNGTVETCFNSSPPGQNGRHFADDLFGCIFVCKSFVFWLKFHWSFFWTIADPIQWCTYAALGGDELTLLIQQSPHDLCSSRWEFKYDFGSIICLLLIMRYCMQYHYIQNHVIMGPNYLCYQHYHVTFSSSN